MGPSAFRIGANEARTVSDTFRMPDSLMAVPLSSWSTFPVSPQATCPSGQGILADAYRRVPQDHIILRVVALQPEGDQVAVGGPHGGRGGRRHRSQQRGREGGETL